MGRRTFLNTLLEKERLIDWVGLSARDDPLAKETAGAEFQSRVLRKP
jgi:hypothetical protein